ncbi:Lipid A export ATP-binding/permease protein MsbA [uncultured Candidatus Thioglobus sp.]|nr:Lipid A export ATP-binding/permease protein MsbA [uncultured Candidatus Thioglobus sp.]
MVFSALLEPMLALMLKPLLDNASDFVIKREWVPFFAIAVMIFLPMSIYGRAYLGGWLNITMQRDFNHDMATRLIQQPLGILAQESSGKITTRFVSFVPSLTQGTMPILVSLLQEPLKVLFYFAQMFYLQWKLALLISIAMPPTAFLVYFFVKRMKKAATRAQKETAHVQSRLNESLTLMPIVKVHGNASKSSILIRAFSALRGSLLRKQIIVAAGQPISMLLVAIPASLVLFYVTAALDAGTMTAGDVATFLGCMLLMPRSLRLVARSTTLLESMLVAAHEIFSFLDVPTEEDFGNKVLHKTQGEIVFDNVSLQYENDEKSALSGVSVKIATGETVALVGRSGAGKTTLANLIPRFYTPQSGVVRLDGTDIREFTLKSLRSNIALVTQDALLFDDTIAANVCYPELPNKDNHAKILHALQNAAAEEFITTMPQGIDSFIGENGKLLSGGQRQRIALARAFYRDAPIVILDEATSALDAETEIMIRTAMQKLLHGRTAIIIAHRFSSVNFADRVLILDAGKLIATGKADELLETCPLYRKLVEAQTLTSDAGTEQ